MFLSDPHFAQIAAWQLKVSERTIQEAMQCVQLDIWNEQEHLPFVLGDGIFCGPLTEQEIIERGFVDLLTNGTCWAAFMQ